DLRGKTPVFRQMLENGASLDDILPEAFATVRETGRRTMGMRHYDCQLIGGMVLHQGKIAEMKTGEGKTLVATLPVYLNALSGKGVHVVTVNDYLAARDAEWMSAVYNFLGMSVGSVLTTDRAAASKKRAYACDITYGTNNEFGFDYLRDNMKFSISEMVQRGHNFAIIDEVDSILVDEARTPLIISGPMDASIDLYAIIDAVVPLLQNEIDFVVDEKGKSVTLTDDGISKVESKLGVDNLYDPANMEVLHHVSQSLKAHYLFKRDRDYVVRENKVVIVDEFTGRLMDGRRWSDGLHQAVEAKEKVRVEQESQVYATITFQNLFRMYDKLAGMTGTAATEAAEFAEIYDLETLVIPTNRPIARADMEDIVFKTQMEKFRAVKKHIEECNANGQPVLVGTTSVEKSEIVARLLRNDGIPHEVLNAKNHGREAQIVAQAGRLGAVTISTNMAGRGTDIKLGGNPEAMAAHLHDPEAEPEEYKAALEKHLIDCAAEAEAVKDVGGLFIIGTERHESRRVDNQLRGRSGRQGDPGGSRFFLCLEDDLMRIFGSDKITVWMERMGLQDDEPIEHRWITSAVENAQRKVEGYNFNIRKNLLEYDDVMNYQRKGVYEVRRRALGNEGIREMVEESIDSVIEDMMDDFVQEGMHPENWDIPKLRENLQRVLGVSWDDETDEELRDHSREELRSRMRTEAGALLDAQVDKMGEEVFLEYARMLVLQFTDQLWKDHLLALDRLRQGVGLRGYGQRNPLLEYKREALQMYLMMSAMRDEEVLKRVFLAQPGLPEAAAASPSRGTARRLLGDGQGSGVQLGAAPRAAGDLFGGGAAGAGSSQSDAGIPEVLPVVAPPAAPPPPPKVPEPGDEARAFAALYGVRRNDPCPCGSGKKFKKCCYEAGYEAPAAT
ncbi:MAG: preprotein translocase subunit SecA, partial [Myxococcota bacterium]